MKCLSFAIGAEYAWAVSFPTDKNLGLRSYERGAATQKLKVVAGVYLYELFRHLEVGNSLPKSVKHVTRVDTQSITLSPD